MAVKVTIRRIMRGVLVLLVVLIMLVAFLLYIFLVPQNISGAVPEATPNGIVITNANLFDGSGDAARVNISIAIGDGIITEISASPIDPGGRYVIDVEGKFVMPGFIETHAHLFFDFHKIILGRTPNSEEATLQYMSKNIPRKLVDYLDKGFTTVVTTGDYFPYIVTVKEELESGTYPGPELVVTGGIFTATGGHPASTICANAQWCSDHVAVAVDTPAEAQMRTREYIEGGVDFIKIGALEGSGPLIQPEVVRAIIDEAHRLGTPVYAHVSNTESMPQFVAWGIDGFVHPSDGIAEDPTPYHTEAARRGFSMSVTNSNFVEFISDLVGLTDSLEKPDASASNTKGIISFIEQGGVPVFGTDTPGFSVWSAKRIGIRSLRRVGLSNAEILRAMTADPARVMLGRNNLGTITVGNIADVLIIDGNPLEDIDDVRFVEMVIQRGVIAVDKR